MNGTDAGNISCVRLLLQPIIRRSLKRKSSDMTLAGLLFSEVSSFIREKLKQVPRHHHPWPVPKIHRRSCMKEVSVDSENVTPAEESEGVSRRKFIGRLGLAVGALGAAPLLGSKETTVTAAPPAAALA